MKHRVTEHDMAMNPVDFMKRGIKLGDIIEVPGMEDHERTVGNYGPNNKAETAKIETPKKAGFFQKLFGKKNEQ